MVENNRFVVDASFVLSILLPDEKTKIQARRYLNLILDPKNKIISTNLLEFEVGNGLRSAFLRKRIKKDSLKVLSNNFKLLPIVLNKIHFDNTLMFAVDEILSYYDATYVYLARKLKSRLLTLDEKLLKLAEK